MDDERTTTPLYATLLYGVIKELDLSIAEYFYLDMVHKLSYQRWCIKSLANCAYDMNISKFGLLKMRDRLLSTDLLEKNAKGHLRVTEKYTEVAVNKVDQFAKRSANKVAQSANKVQRIGQQSLPKSYIDIHRTKQPKKIYNKFGMETLESAQARLSVKA